MRPRSIDGFFRHLFQSLIIGLLTIIAASGCGGSSNRANSGKTGSANRSADTPADLTGAEIRDYHAYLEKFPSPCDANILLGACTESPNCTICPTATRFVVLSIRDGFDQKEVEARYLTRFGPDRTQTIVIDQAPTKGPANAPITIVEFADYQCPFCASAAQIIDALVEKYSPHVRIAFMDYPLTFHQNARSAAQAGIAAHRQGKFWELHHIMFAHPDALERTDIERYARSLNLDMAKFRSDWDSSNTKAMVQKSIDHGNKLGVRGTPYVFINGRHFDTSLFELGGEDILQWIELEIEITTGKPFQR